MTQRIRLNYQPFELSITRTALVTSGAIPAEATEDVDICVSAAGIVDAFAPAHSMSAEKWSRDIDVNLTGAFRVIQAGLHGMMRTIAIENCSCGITANSILPGMIATPRVLVLPRADQERIKAAVPSGRFGRPEEVADVVAFRACDDSGYITAQEIGVGGGLQLNSLYVGATLGETA